jgi:hypothetical protein
VSVRTPKRSSVTRVVTPTRQAARVRFHHVAVVESDPVKFAQKLEETENELVEQGWNLTSLMHRGEDAVIVNAQREEQAPELFSASTQPSPPDAFGEGHTEVIYSYLEDGKLKDLRLPCMADAITAVRAHLGDERFIPNRIVSMNVIAYEPLKDLPILEKMYGRCSHGRLNG